MADVSFDPDTMLLTVHPSSEATKIDLRTLLHDVKCLDRVTQVDSSKKRLRVRKGAFEGVRGFGDVYTIETPAHAMGDVFDSPYEAACARLKSMEQKRRARADEEEGEDVEFVAERTREERDAEGRANAIEIEE